MILSFAACSTPKEETPISTPESEPAGKYTPGTYKNTARGFGGDVTVELTFSKDAITDAKIVGIDETSGIGSMAIERMPEQILSSQSADVDGVSGATISSGAVKTAAQICIDEAMGVTQTAAVIADGTYNASAVSYGWTGMLTCDVTFKDGRLSAIDVVEEYDTYTGEIAPTAFSNYIPRVIEAQSLAVDAVSGATSTSNAIRACVEDAIVQAGGSLTDWQKPVAKSSGLVKLEGYDVIVVGLGGSGILSYCAAAEQGAAVFGIETTAKLGGQSATTYGPMAINSQHMKDDYFEGKDYIDADEVYKTWMDYLDTEKKADIVKKAVYESGTALDWAIDSFQFGFDGLKGMLGSFLRTDWTALWTVFTADAGNTSWNVIGPNKTFQFDRAMKLAVEMNAKNDYKLELTATSLLFDADKKVIGVKAESYDGTIYEIYGDSVIIGTGGYIGSADMMNEYLDGPVNTVAYTVNDGDGIKLAQSAGAALYNVSVPPMIHITQVKNIIKNNDLTADQKAILSALCLVTGQPAVTKNGDIWGGGEICMAPGYEYYVVYTAEEIEAIKTNGLSETLANAKSHFMGQGGEMVAGEPVADIDTILEVGIRYGNVIKASSISELAKAIGCDEAALKKSLNSKDGEYYAVIAAGYAYGTVGGIDVDANMNALREDGTPIKNLFVVGQDSQGVCNTEKAPYTPWGGQAQSWIFVSGRTAGVNAANHSK